jgi:hypothetical protein
MEYGYSCGQGRTGGQLISARFQDVLRTASRQCQHKSVCSVKKASAGNISHEAMHSTLKVEERDIIHFIPNLQ